MQKEDILDFLSAKKEFMRESFGVLKIGLFGSCARGDNNEKSDIDIAVELKRENKGDNFFRLLHFLEDNLGAKIDLGIEQALKERIKQEIQKEIIYV